MYSLQSRIIGIRLLFAAFVAAASPHSAVARQVVDSAGRSVTVPDKITRVFGAGPPASVLLYVLRPDVMTSWARTMRPEDRKYVVPSVRELPEGGRLTG